MLISIDHHSGVPVYRQIIDQIKFYVASGLLGPGEEIPSTRTLSSQLGVNPMTVSKAFGYLEVEGIVERRRGRPLTVRPMTQKDVGNTKLEQLAEGLRPVVTLSRQLGLNKAQILKVLRELLDERQEGEGSS